MHTSKLPFIYIFLPIIIASLIYSSCLLADPLMLIVSVINSLVHLFPQIFFPHIKAANCSKLAQTTFFLVKKTQYMTHERFIVIYL